MKKAYQTLKSKEFKETYEKGEKFVGKFFVVFVLYGQNVLKIGFVASKKVGNAVKRNRAKRLMREIVRLNQSFLRKDVHIIMLARKNILYGSFKDIEDSLIYFFNRFLKRNER